MIKIATALLLIALAPLSISQISSSGQNLTTSTGATVTQYCLETDTASTCIKNKRCCHVTNTYSSYSYSACVDTQSTLKGDHLNFCNVFKDTNANNNYKATECVCNDVTAGSKMMEFAMYTLIITIITIFY